MNDAILDTKRRRLRVLEEQKAQFGNLCPPHIITEIEDLQREIAELTGSLGVAALPRPPQPDFVHPYPLQSNFTGRVAERNVLTEWLSHGTQPVLALIAIGGMGKSALTWVWVQKDVLGLTLPGATTELPEVSAACRVDDECRPEAVLWWSFYETQASFTTFLDEAISYTSDRGLNPRDLASPYDKARALLNLLQQRRFLIVLDGFERELRAYSSLSAPYQDNAADKEAHSEHRACTDPHTARFLRDAATLPLKSHILLTSRLFPSELDELAGCKRQDLVTLDPEDAVTFFRSQGIRGTRAEIQTNCMPYGYHALALRLLAGVIVKDRRTPRDISVARRYPVLPELKGRERHHILQVAYDALDDSKRKLLSQIAAFRSPTPYDTLSLLNQIGDERQFSAALDELGERGLLLFNDTQACYDLHPVVRTHAYQQLNEADKTAIHLRLRSHFSSNRPAKLIERLEDLNPLIELYYHTLGSGYFDSACTLFIQKLHTPLYHQFGAHQAYLELLLPMFLSDRSLSPLIRKRGNRVWIPQALARVFSRIGQPRRAEKAYQLSLELAEKLGFLDVFVTNTQNLANEYIALGKLLDAHTSLARGAELCKTRKDVHKEATTYARLDYIDMLLGKPLHPQQDRFDALLSLTNTKDIPELRILLFSLESESALIKGEAAAALPAAKALDQLANNIKNEPQRIRSKWLLGEAYSLLENVDEAEIYLIEALTGCRRINLVTLEPEILMAWARLYRFRGNTAQSFANAQEALSIADRCEYRLKQADIHNFLALLALDAGNRAEARRHAEIARERAWCDGPPHCYKPALDEADRLLREIGAQ